MECIDSSLQCDGKQDCLEGEDERACSKSLDVSYNIWDGRIEQRILTPFRNHLQWTDA